MAAGTQIGEQLVNGGTMQETVPVQSRAVLLLESAGVGEP